MASSQDQGLERPATINVLITSFPGLGLPSTLSLPVPATASVSDVTALFAARMPQTGTRLILTTTSNKELLQSSQARITDFLYNDKDDFLPLRLSVPLCGGKGGFGSQLRAAGGRMSSRRKKNQAENNGSSRNLDGRRIRTVAEAKSLAEYLATKPNMEKREKEAKRKRWEEVIELTERRQEELKNGKMGKMDAEWVAEREYQVARIRRVALASSASASSSASSSSTSSSKPKEAPSQKCWGFDEEDEFMSDSEDEEGEEDNDSEGSGDKDEIMEGEKEEDEEGEDDEGGEEEEEEEGKVEVVGKGKGKA